MIEAYAHYCGKKALRHAMGHIHPLRFAPFGHYEAVANDKACGFAARLQGAKRLPVGFSCESQVVSAPEVARCFRFVGPVIRYGFVDLARIQINRVRSTMLPLESGGKSVSLANGGEYAQNCGKQKAYRHRILTPDPLIL